MSTRRVPVPLALVPSSDRRSVSDADLARGMQSGDSWALSEAWRRFAPMVIVMAARTLGSETEAEDLAQEVFYRVFRKARELRDPSSLRSFVFSFALRLVKTELRHRKALGWLSFHRSESLPEGVSPSVDIESRDLLRRFYMLLDRLGTRPRLVFCLRYLERMTVEEIASNLDLSMSTVKRALAHATSKLSGWVRSDFGDLGDLALRDGWMGSTEQ